MYSFVNLSSLTATVPILKSIRADTTVSFYLNNVAVAGNTCSTQGVGNFFDMVPHEKQNTVTGVAPGG